MHTDIPDMEHSHVKQYGNRVSKHLKSLPEGRHFTLKTSQVRNGRMVHWGRTWTQPAQSDRPTDTSFHVARDTQIALYAITDSDYFILKSENNFQYILFTQLQRIMAVSRWWERDVWKRSLLYWREPTRVTSRGNSP